MSMTETTATPDEIADFLAECETSPGSFYTICNATDTLLDQRKKLVAMVRHQQETLAELQRILEDAPHETQTPDS